MQVTNVKVKLTSVPGEKLCAYCTITLDNEFVIRDVKIIEGANGHFVAMPSRKVTDRCPTCGGKNHLRAKFCNDCGGKLDPNRGTKDEQGRVKLHLDLAHPINQECRQRLETAAVEAYKVEVTGVRAAGGTIQGGGSGGGQGPRPGGDRAPRPEGLPKDEGMPDGFSSGIHG
ncbi:MAG: septation protein SpoVG family protein [Planctomycetes bacterium]|nr:septation protein SpoVG family protein [Planctomycetota bacterium]